MREPFIVGRGDRAASELEEADRYDPVSVFRVPRQAQLSIRQIRCNLSIKL